MDSLGTSRGDCGLQLLLKLPDKASSHQAYRGEFQPPASTTSFIGPVFLIKYCYESTYEETMVRQ